MIGVDTVVIDVKSLNLDNLPANINMHTAQIKKYEDVL